jgi:perosamine synthetase
MKMNIKIENLLINRNSTIREIMRVINANRIGVSILVEKESNKFISMVTDGDIRRALLKGFGLNSCIDEFPRVGNATTVQSDTPLSDVMQLFSDKIRVIPILDNKYRVIDLHLSDNRRRIAVAQPFFDDKEIDLVNECIVSGWVSSNGKFVEKFEEMVARHTGTKYAVSCNSGTSALHLILMAHGIGAGDEVIIPSLTFAATANAVTYTGAKPIFVDSDIETWNIDVSKIEIAITKNTKAIIPVHLYGHPADMDPINKIAKEFDLIVIEDAAEAQGASYKNRMVGSLSDAATFSFFGNKIITTGEGGMVVTNNLEIAEKCRLLRNHGMTKDKRYWHEVVGYNYRLTNIQAAIGVAQMGKIDLIIQKKLSVAKEYNNLLKGVEWITLPPNKSFANSVYWLYTIIINEDKAGFDVNTLMKVFKKNKIDSRIVFYPLHTLPIYKTNEEFPVSEKLHKMGISLPSAPDMDKKDIKEITDIIISQGGL